MTNLHSYLDAWEYQRKITKLSPTNNSVDKIGVISLRLVAVIVGNQMQIRMFSAYKGIDLI